MPRALFFCGRCGLVYFGLATDIETKVCHCGKMEWEPLAITAQAFEYSEAGGEITGIDVTISIG